MIVRTRIVLARCHQWAGKDHWMVLRQLQSSQPAPSRSTLPVPQRRIQSAIKVESFLYYQNKHHHHLLTHKILMSQLYIHLRS